MTKRGSRGSGKSPPLSYVAKYDYPDIGVVAGQVFHGIENVPANITVVPVPKP